MLKVDVAVFDFLAGRLVTRRQALERIGDPTTEENEGIVRVGGHGLIAKSRLEQRPVQQFTG